jgi:hypothetical protein
MDGQDYGFEIQDEELDLLGDAYSETAKPATQYTAKPSEASEEEGGEEVDDIEDFDPLADPEETEATANGEESPAGSEQEAGADEPEGDEEKEVVDPLDVETFQLIAENLVQQGLLVLDENEEKISVKSPEELAQRFQTSFQKGAINHINNIVGQYGPEYAEAFSLIFEQGLNPYEYFTRQQQIDSIESMNLEDENVQKQVLRTYYQKQGLSTERVEAKIQKSVDFGDLEADSKEYHDILLQAERKDLEARAQQVASQREAEARQNQEYIQSVQSVLTEKLKEQDYDGIPLTAADRDKALEFISKPKWQLANGQVITDADRWWIEMKSNPALAAKFALMASNNFDTTRIQKKSVSKENSKLFANLTQKNKVVQRQAPTKPSSNSFFD